MSIDFSKLNILVIEDVEPMRTLIVKILESIGIKNVRSKANGQEGFEEFCYGAYDIVITDWEMEPVNGMDLTKRIRTDTSSPNRMVPIIVITGYSALDRVKKARDIGVTEFLVKPFSAADMMHRIAAVINKPRDFVEVEQDYFGPDRRRIKDPHFTGPYKRFDDDEPSTKNDEENDDSGGGAFEIDFE